jgi:hypothetical protein
MKTKIKMTINNQYRVLWKKNEIYAGYEDFNTEQQALNFVKKLTL